MRIALLKGIHVDRDREVAMFRSMLRGSPGPNILLIEAESGMGKTCLLNEFRAEARGVACSVVNLKESNYGVRDLLRRLVYDLGGQRSFPLYSQCLKEDVRPSLDLLVEGSTIRKSSFNLAFDNRDNEFRVGALGDAFFADIMTFEDTRGPTLVVIFDTYEKASSEVGTWIASQFLSFTRERPWIVVVVAGQTIPDLEYGLGEWFVAGTLDPLGPEHVEEYLRRVDCVHDEETVRVLLAISKGRPHQLAVFVADLLIESGGRG